MSSFYSTSPTDHTIYHSWQSTRNAHNNENGKFSEDPSKVWRIIQRCPNEPLGKWQILTNMAKIRLTNFRFIRQNRHFQRNPFGGCFGGWFAIFAKYANFAKIALWLLWLFFGQIRQCWLIFTTFVIFAIFCHASLSPRGHFWHPISIFVTPMEKFCLVISTSQGAPLVNSDSQFSPLRAFLDKSESLKVETLFVVFK